MWKILVAIAVVLLVGYWQFGNPDAIFRSSDGKWADSEVRFKGRDFKTIVWYFEAYKLSCAAPHATLVRATPQYRYDVFAWPSYYSDPKWRVPFSDAHPEIGDYYPPVSVASCSNRGVSDDVYKAANANAAKYIAGLK